jgi:hypothetical protein
MYASDCQTGGYNNEYKGLDKCHWFTTWATIPLRVAWSHIIF